MNVAVVFSAPQTSAQLVESPEHSVVHEVENTSVICACTPVACSSTSTRQRRRAQAAATLAGAMAATAAAQDLGKVRE